MPTESAFEIRKRDNESITRIRNEDLPAGSPMYFYCQLCGAEMAMPEDFVGPAPRLCDDCLAEGRI